MGEELVRAWPLKLDAPGLNATGSSVAVDVDTKAGSVAADAMCNLKLFATARVGF